MTIEMKGEERELRLNGKWEDVVLVIHIFMKQTSIERERERN